MAQDQFGNYVVDMTNGSETVVPMGGIPVIYGDGAPTADTPISQIYINRTTGEIYVWNGSAYVLSAGGGGAGTNYLIFGDGPPVNPPADPTKVWLYFDRTAFSTGYPWDPDTQTWTGA